MTNFEKHKSAIFDLIADGKRFAVVNGRPCACSKTLCTRCDLKSTNPEVRTCQASDRKNWLNAEYIEKPRLSKNERALCELLKPWVWLAREQGNRLKVFSHRPKKTSFGWTCEPQHEFSILKPILFDVYFKFITSTDAEPWEVDDLLKLEVEE